MCWLHGIALKGNKGDIPINSPCTRFWYITKKPGQSVLKSFNPINISKSQKQSKAKQQHERGRTGPELFGLFLIAFSSFPPCFFSMYCTLFFLPCPPHPHPFILHFFLRPLEYRRHAHRTALCPPPKSFPLTSNRTRGPEEEQQRRRATVDQSIDRGKGGFWLVVGAVAAQLASSK